MTLKDYIILHKEDCEITVFDDVYDIETYFYYYDPNSNDVWDCSCWKLAAKLEVLEVNNNGVIVNLSNLIEKNLKNTKSLFCVNKIDWIMDDIENILAGYVSEEWFSKFVDALEA